MISLSHLSKLIVFLIFLSILTFNSAIAENEAADIWKENNNQEENNDESDSEKDITIESPILSGDIEKIVIKIDEDNLEREKESVIGIFDPEENNFNLNMWSSTDGSEIKKVLNRINKLKLAKISEDLLFQVLFTNAYPPKKQLNANDFLDIKINWLIKQNRINDLESFLKANPEVGENPKAIKF